MIYVWNKLNHLKLTVIYIWQCVWRSRFYTRSRGNHISYLFEVSTLHCSVSLDIVRKKGVRHLWIVTRKQIASMKSRKQSCEVPAAQQVCVCVCVCPSQFFLEVWCSTAQIPCSLPSAFSVCNALLRPPAPDAWRQQLHQWAEFINAYLLRYHAPKRPAT